MPRPPLSELPISSGQDHLLHGVGLSRGPRDWAEPRVEAFMSASREIKPTPAVLEAALEVIVKDMSVQDVSSQHAQL